MASTSPRRFERRQLVFVNGRYAPELSSPARDRRRRGREPRATCCASSPQLVEQHLGAPRARHGRRLRRPEHRVPRGRRFVLRAPGAVLTGARSTSSSLDRGGSAEPRVAIRASWSCAGRAEPGHDRRELRRARRRRLPHQRGHRGRARGRRGRRPLQGAARERGRLPRRHLARAPGPRSALRSTMRSSLGAALARNDVDQVVRRRGRRVRAQRAVHGARARQHVDTHTRIDHAQPHCTSRELYKGVLDGRARGVFVGTHPRAARTRRRPTPSRPTRTCCSRARRWWTACPSSRSSPTT